MATRIVAALVRSLLLFLFSVALVVGFNYHSRFYSLGLETLLLGGGLLTSGVILAGRYILAGELPRGRPKSAFSFSSEDGPRVLSGAITMSFLPLDSDPPQVGDVVLARYEGGTEFGRLLTLDSDRTFVRDITEDEALKGGYRSATALRDAFSRKRWHLDDVVALIEFRGLGVSKWKPTTS